MVDRGLYNHIQNAIAQGKRRDEIEAGLAKGGWNQDQIDEAYSAVERGEVPEAGRAGAKPLQRARHARKVTGYVVVLIAGLLALAGIAYLWYYIVPTLDFDALSFEITAYPAICQTESGAVSYSVDTAPPVTFKLDAAQQQVTEYVYPNYQSAFQRGNATSTHVFDTCNITNRSNWQCTEGGITLGFSNGEFFNSAQSNPNICFVSRAQWYRLVYPGP